MLRRIPVATVLAACLTAVATAGDRQVAFPNTLTNEEFDSGFELLFDGTGFDGWRNNGNWSVEDGAIVHDRSGGALVYNKRNLPLDFELRFEWQVDRGADGGVLYRPGQCEFQVLDDSTHPDGRNPRTSSGSLYFCMPPATKAAHPAGRWNTGRIVRRGSVTQHWINGRKVVDFDHADKRWRRHVALHTLRGGNVAARPTLLRLADQEGLVRYRSLRLRELAETDEIGHHTLVPPEIDEGVQRAEVEFLERLQRKRASVPPLH